MRWLRIPPIQTATGKDGPILIVLQLAGGNDGMNTVIPYADDAYYRARPVIGIPKDNVIKINDYAGLNPKLAGLKGLYDEGHLSILQGVGYPNPNRSHFRSTEIWQTASDSDKVEPYGWLGRYFDSCCKGADPTVGVAIGNQIAAILRGRRADRRLVLPARAISLGQRRTGRRSSEQIYREMNRRRWICAPLDENDGGSIEMLAGAAARTDHARKHPGFPPAHRARRADELRQNPRNRQQISRQRRLSPHRPRR